MGSTDYQPVSTSPDTHTRHSVGGGAPLTSFHRTTKQATVRLRVSECTELTGVVDAVQQFDGASTDHSANVNQESRWKGGQGEEGELLLKGKSLVSF